MDYVEFHKSMKPVIILYTHALDLLFSTVPLQCMIPHTLKLSYHGINYEGLMSGLAA